MEMTSVDFESLRAVCGIRRLVCAVLGAMGFSSKYYFGRKKKARVLENACSEEWRRASSRFGLRGRRREYSIVVLYQVCAVCASLSTRVP